MKLFEQGTFVTPYGLSAEEIVARRKRLDENKPDFGNARYIGEGIGDAVAGFLWGKNARRLDKMEGDERKRLKDLIASAFGGSSLMGGIYSGAPGGSYGGSPAYAKPDPLAPQAIADDAMRALDKPLQSSNIQYDPNNPEKLAADAMTILGFQPQYLKYDNAGAIRNKPLSPEAEAAFSFLPEMGLEARIVSGGQDADGPGHTGGPRHNFGGAGDMDFYKDGRRLSTDNPEDMPYFREIARRGVGAGFTGMGEGADYMGAGRMHIGYGAPATWGANGDSANTPSWLGQAYAQGVSDYGQPTQARVASNERFSAANNPLVNTAAQIAREEGVPEDLFLGLVQQESSWNPDAVSSAGAIGLAQLMPGTARDLGVDPNDPEQNLRGGARYLKAQLDRFGSPELALAAYNAGPERVARAGGIPNIEETQNYVSRITGNLGNPPQVAPAGGGQRVAQGSQGMGNAALWAEILSNPFADSGQRAVAQMMLQQAMTQGQPQKGVVVNGRLVNPYTGEVIGDYSGGAGGGETEYGLTPQMIQMEDGSLGFMQLGKDGTSKLVELPEGASIAKGYEKVDLGTHFQWFDPLGKPFGEPVAKDVRGEASESAAGAAEGKAGADAAINAPKIRADSEQTLALINQLLDPKNQGALEGILGKYEGNLEPGTLKGALFLSQEETDLIPLVEQLQGKTFLQAYAQLRGAQAITDIEGQKATQAIARLQRTQGPEAFRAALIELMGIIETGMRRLESGQTVGAPTDAYGMSDDEFLKSLGLE